MFYLGVDGGGTKTDFILINDQGHVLAYTIKGSCYHEQVQWSAFERILEEGIGEVCAWAGITIDDINYSFFGLPAYGEVAQDTVLMETIVQTILQNQRFQCGNDVEAGWAGSLACLPGINLVAGTGTLGFGKDQHGNTARAGGWGCFCGDEGSAYWLGKQLLSMFGKQADGREEKTPLYDIVRKEFNITRDFDLIGMVYDSLKLKRDEIAKLALLVYQAAKQGDPKALAFYDMAAYENSLTVKSLLHRLHFTQGADIAVSYSGGVFKAGEFILTPLQRYLAEVPIVLMQPVLLPVTGAALYALTVDGLIVVDKMITTLKHEEEMMVAR